MRLNGIFALAIWDGRSQTFMLARDHVGIKPLYYFDDGHTFARHVPPSLWERPKSGFAIPLSEWFRKDLRTWVQDELTLNWDWTAGLINRRAAEEMIGDHLSGRANYSTFLWGFLSWRSWLRRVGLLS